MPDVFIGFYAPDGTSRGVNQDAILTPVTWEYLEAGGMGQSGFSFKETFDAPHKVQGGDTVKIWVGETNGPLETFPRYIGQIATPTDTLDLAETYSLTAFGEMEAMNRIRIDCTIIRPGGADLAEFADYLLSHYSARKGETFEFEFLETGVLLESLLLEDATVREGFNKLFSHAPGAVVWGWEVSPLTGNKRCYLRPRVATVGWSVPAGEGVRVINRTREYSDIANHLQPLKGGKARFHNAVGLAVKDASGKPNSSFEHPAAVAETEGNIFRNYSFENRVGGDLSHWDLPGGATHKTEAAHLGNRGVELDALNERAYQEQFTSLLAPVPGRPYELFFWMRRKTGNQGSEVTPLLKWVNAAGVQQGSDVTFIESADSVLWERKFVRTICPANATGYKIEFRLTADLGDGVYLDDVGLFDRSAVEQPGWESFPRGSATVIEEDWAYEGDAKHGCLSYRIKGESEDEDEHDIAIRPKNNVRIPVSAGQEIHYGFWVKSPPGIATVPKVILRIAPKKEDGSDAGTVEEETPFPAGPALADWTPYENTYVLSGEAVSTEFALIIRGDGELLIDAAFVRDASTDPLEYIEGDTWERDVAATEVCTPGTDAYLSESIYGRQEDTTTNESLVEWNDEAKAFAKTWFEERAVIGGPQRVELDNEETQKITPGDGTKLRVVGLALTFSDWWPVRTLYTWNGKLPVGVELGSLDPTLAKLLSVNGNQSASGGGSASASGGGSGAISGSPSVGVQDDSGPIYRRGKINFKPGANITLAIVDDAPGDAVDVEIATTGGGSVGITLIETHAGSGLLGGPITTSGSIYIAPAGVSTAMLADGAVTLAKLGTTGTPDATKFLRGDFNWAALSSAFINRFLGYGIPLVAPDATGFSWVNQGTATISNGTNAFMMVAPATGSHNLRLRTKAAPGTPYTVVMGFLTLHSSTTLNSALIFGWRDSGAGTLRVYAVYKSATTALAISRNHMNSPTSINSSANYSEPTMHVLVGGGAIFFRMVDDGTNHILSISNDGENWFQFDSVVRTTFTATPDEFVWGLNPVGGNVQTTLFHMAVT